jgi:hypothetical protein
VNIENGELNSQKFISVMGFHMALYVALKFPNPHHITSVPDRLIFIITSHDCYYVKIDYHMSET